VRNNAAVRDLSVKAFLTRGITCSLKLLTIACLFSVVELEVAADGGCQIIDVVVSHFNSIKFGPSKSSRNSSVSA
jgi:hypothetical protein